jgi:hypothetical protein
MSPRLGLLVRAIGGPLVAFMIAVLVVTVLSAIN